MNAIEIVPLDRSHLHLDEAVRMIAEAFVNDPGVVAIIKKPPEKRLPFLRRHFAMQAEASLSGGASRCALLDGKPVGFMLIAAPGADTFSTLDTVKLLLRALFNTNPGILWRSIISSLEDEKHRPREPNYFLETLAVEPTLQGRGIGSAMLAHLTDISDAEGVLTYLSTTEPKTIALYEKHGFEIVAETWELRIRNCHLVRTPKASS
jgi:ribosomal protein S18 acetylase RimI-like enzyme